MSNDAVRMSREALAEQLRIAGGQVNGNEVKCPFHADNRPSGSLHKDSSGVWRYTCHTTSCGFSGDIIDVLSRMSGKKPAEILQERRNGCPPTTTIPSGKKSQEPVKETILRGLEEVFTGLKGKVEARYEYTHPDTGAIELVVVRYLDDQGKKSFSQAHPVDGGWVRKAPPKPWPLYNRAGIRDADPVIVVEGEKCADALISLGIPATTSPCGAGKAEYSDWSPLAGKMIYLWPDNDEPGIKYMRQVAEILHRLEPVCQVHWIDPAGLNLPPKGDVADFLEFLGPIEQRLRINAVLSVLGDARADGVAAEVEAVIEDTITGKRQSIDWPWARLSELCKSLLPGTVTLICGEPGATKSFFVLEALIHWHRHGVKTCIFELEEDRSYHLYRILAQVIGRSEILDDKWAAVQPDFMRQVYRDNAAFLESIGRVIWEAPDKQITMKGLAGWVRDRGKDGYRVIVVDPVTAAATTATPWTEDLEFLIDVKNAARECKCSVVLVTHPRQFSGKSSGVSMDNLAGGRAYPRFSQTVLWIERHKMDKEVAMMDGDQAIINRTVHIAKARNGKGHGLQLGFYFYGDALTFRELGVIKPRGWKSEKSEDDSVPDF